MRRVVGGDASATGLRALYAAMHETIERNSFTALAIVVHDPTLGAQVFVAGTDREAALAGCVENGARWCAVPPVDVAPPELATLQALALTALRLGEWAPDADPDAALEVAIRALAGVRAVTRDGAVLRVIVDEDARDGLLGTLAALAPPGPVLVVEPALGPVRATSGARVELLAVQSRPESAEVEVHLRLGEHRTVGRGPLSRTVTSAAEATLAALHELGEVSGTRVGWVRTVDTTPERRFVVGASVLWPTGAVTYGMAGGASPIDAAARATLDAVNRVMGAPTP